MIFYHLPQGYQVLMMHFARFSGISLAVIAEEYYAMTTGSRSGIERYRFTSNNPDSVKIKRFISIVDNFIFLNSEI